MKKSAVIFNQVFLIFGILCIVYYLGMGITIRFGQSLLFLWPIVGLLCILRWALMKRAWARGERGYLPRPLLIALRAVVLVCLAYFLFVEAFIATGAWQKPPAGLDGIVILGARVNDDGPSGSLAERIDAAARYLRANPETVAVASGGQGDDEPMSEARCIYEQLVSAGIDPARIRLEEASTDTWENLTNSFAILGDSVQTVGIVTNDFHIFRALGVARRLGGYSFYGVPAHSSVFGFIHYAMREFVAVNVQYLKGQLLFA